MPISTILNNQAPAQYFNFSYDQPDVIVVLNRGTNFEQDITNDILSFNTSNDIESIVGNFTMNVDNTNDEYVNRFNYTSIKKMSSMEIFAKSLNAGSDIDVKMNTVTDSVQVPRSARNLNEFIDTFYNSPEESKRVKIQQQIVALNKFRKLPVRGFRIYKSNSIQGKQISNIVVSNNTITLTFPPDKKKEPVTIKIADNGIITDNSLEVRFRVTDEGSLSTLRSKSLSNIVQTVAVSKDDPIESPKDFQLTIDDRTRMDEIRQIPLKIPRPSDLYRRVFEGVILNITQNISPGQTLSLTLNGKTNGYWMEATSVNVFPSQFEQQFTNIDLPIYSNRYNNTKALDIFKDLIRFSTDDLAVVTDQTFGNNQTSLEFLELNSKFDKNFVDAFGQPLKVINPITGEEAKDEKSQNIFSKYDNKRPAQQLNEMETKSNDIYRGLPLNIPKGTTETSNTLTGNATWTRLAGEYRKAESNLDSAEREVDKFSKREDFIKSTENDPNRRATQLAANALSLQSARRKKNGFDRELITLRGKMDDLPEVKSNQKAIDTNRKDLMKDMAVLTKSTRNKILDEFGITEHWKKIFAKNVLEVIDTQSFLELVYPFKWGNSTPGLDIDGDYIPKAQLAQQVAEKIMFEFFVDTNGHFILKPPLYSAPVPEQDGDLYIVKEEDLVSMSLNDTVDGIITRIGVVGDWREAPQMEPFMIYNIHQDFNLIRDYGFHSREIANRTFLISPQDCRDFGKAYMTKNNMELFNASVTIMGRPGIRLGMSIYIKPRDTVYYIKGISHEFTVGGQFTTTLTLIAGRRIVTGFPAKKTITTITKDQTKINSIGRNPISTSESEITYFILSNSTNQDALTDDQFTDTGDEPRLSRKSELNAQQIEAAKRQNLSLNPEGNKLTDDNTLGNKNTPIILRNIFQITNHVNPAFIGLIVDRESEAISSINIANYNLFKNLSIDNIPDGARKIKVKENKVFPGIKIIKDFFNKFVQEKKISSNGSNFTIGNREDFILEFLQDSRDKLENDELSAARKDVQAASASLFNDVINSLDNNGIYRQYTDADGRELPAYLDYGKSLLIQDGTARISRINVANKASKEERDAKENADKRARQSFGASKPESFNASEVILPFESQFKEIGIDLREEQNQTVARWEQQGAVEGDT